MVAVSPYIELVDFIQVCSDAGEIISLLQQNAVFIVQLARPARHQDPEWEVLEEEGI
jgi:hypothetical protein